MVRAGGVHLLTRRDSAERSRPRIVNSSALVLFSSSRSGQSRATIVYATTALVVRTVAEQGFPSMSES